MSDRRPRTRDLKQYDTGATYGPTRPPGVPQSCLGRGRIPRGRWGPGYRTSSLGSQEGIGRSPRRTSGTKEGTLKVWEGGTGRSGLSERGRGCGETSRQRSDSDGPGTGHLRTGHKDRQRTDRDGAPEDRGTEDRGVVGVPVGLRQRA